MWKFAWTRISICDSGKWGAFPEPELYILPMYGIQTPDALSSRSVASADLATDVSIPKAAIPFC